MTKQEIIEVFIVRSAPSGREELRRDLEQLSRDELEAAYAVLQANQAVQTMENELLRIRAEIAANRALVELQVRRQREPQRKAQLEQDRKTFAEAARTLRSFAVNEANFNIIRQTLGEGFSVYQIQELIAANGASPTLSPPTQQELDEYQRQDIEAHNLRLLSADLPTLRRLTREAGAHIATQPVAPDETQRVRAASRDDGFKYQQLPDEIRIGDREEVLDAAFIRRADAATLRLLIKRYGSEQVTEALRTRKSDASPLW
jgi:hypothetical protein